MTAEIRAVGDKVNRASERESALGQKVEGHEDRIWNERLLDCAKMRDTSPDPSLLLAWSDPAEFFEAIEAEGGHRLEEGACVGMKKHGCAVYGTMKQERIGRDAVRPKGEGMDARIKTVCTV